MNDQTLRTSEVKESAEEMIEIFKNEPGKPSVVILSVSCCQSWADSLDRQLEKNVDEALKKQTVDMEIRKVTLSAIHKHKKVLRGEYPRLIKRINSIFLIKGYEGFPALVANGEVLTFGEIPDVELIIEKMTGVLH